MATVLSDPRQPIGCPDGPTTWLSPQAYTAIPSLYGPGSCTGWFLLSLAVLINYLNVIYFGRQQLSRAISWSLVDFFAMIAYPAVAAGHLLVQQLSLPLNKRDTLYSVARCLRRDTFVGPEQHGAIPSYEASFPTGPTIDVTSASVEDVQRVLSILASRSVVSLFVTTGAVFFPCFLLLSVYRRRWCLMGCVFVTAYLWCLGVLCLSAFTFGSPLHTGQVWLLFFSEIMLRARSLSLMLGIGVFMLWLTIYAGTFILRVGLVGIIRWGFLLAATLLILFTLGRTIIQEMPDTGLTIVELEQAVAVASGGIVVAVNIWPLLFNLMSQRQI